MSNEKEKEVEKIVDIAWYALLKIANRVLWLVILGIFCWGLVQFGLGWRAAYCDVAEGMSCAKANVKMTTAGWRLTDQFTLVQSRGYNWGYRFYIQVCTDYLDKEGIKRLYENLKK